MPGDAPDLRLLVFDLVPALVLEPSSRHVVAGAHDTLAALFARYRLAAVGDAEESGHRLRERLQRAGIGDFFESVGTSADFGSLIGPAVIRRVASTVGVSVTRVAVVTGRPELAANLAADGVHVVLIDGTRPLGEVPDRLTGRLTEG